MRDDTGTSTMPLTITASDAPRTYRFVVSNLADFKLTFTCGVVPTTWTWTIILHCGGLSVTR